MSGGLGWEKTPVAPTTKRAVIVRPSAVDISHRSASSSNAAPLISVFSWMRGRRP